MTKLTKSGGNDAGGIRNREKENNRIHIVVSNWNWKYWCELMVFLEYVAR